MNRIRFSVCICLSRSRLAFRLLSDFVVDFTYCLVVAIDSDNVLRILTSFFDCMLDVTDEAEDIDGDASIEVVVQDRCSLLFVPTIPLHR
jgi:hypothetical protein